MTRAAPLTPDIADRVEPLPGWITLGDATSPDELAFMSGAALAHLYLVAKGDAIPHHLWRERQALAAAEVGMALIGRRERAQDLRDAVGFLRPGDHPGPAGEVLVQWQRAVSRPLSGLARALPAVPPDQIALCLARAEGNPVARAAAVLASVLADHPRLPGAALVLADAALSRALGWDHVLPLLATQLSPRDLRGDDLAPACHRAVVGAARKAVQVVADLQRRAVRLQAVVPKLRAKPAAAAVEAFLSRDALPPQALHAMMSDRAARRLCDRLVDLGVLRELTGRDSFRLYGV